MHFIVYVDTSTYWRIVVYNKYLQLNPTRLLWAAMPFTGGRVGAQWAQAVLRRYDGIGRNPTLCHSATQSTPAHPTHSNPTHPTWRHWAVLYCTACHMIWDGAVMAGLLPGIQPIIPAKTNTDGSIPPHPTHSPYSSSLLLPFNLSSFLPKTISNKHQIIHPSPSDLSNILCALLPSRIASLLHPASWPAHSTVVCVFVFSFPCRNLTPRDFWRYY